MLWMTLFWATIALNITLAFVIDKAGWLPQDEHLFLVYLALGSINWTLAIIVLSRLW